MEDALTSLPHLPVEDGEVDDPNYENISYKSQNTGLAFLEEQLPNFHLQNIAEHW